MSIRNQSGQMLPYSLAHDARLAMMDGEILFMEKHGDVRCEPVNASVE